MVFHEEVVVVFFFASIFFDFCFGFFECCKEEFSLFYFCLYCNLFFFFNSPMEPTFWKRGYQGGIPGLPIWMEEVYLLNDLKIMEGENLISSCWGRFLTDRRMALSLTCPWFSGKSSFPEGPYFFRRWKMAFPKIASLAPEESIIFEFQTEDHNQW